MRAEATQARSSLVVLRHPGKVAGILGGNLGGQLVQAIVLGICLAAFGAEGFIIPSMLGILLLLTAARPRLERKEGGA